MQISVGAGSGATLYYIPHLQPRFIEKPLCTEGAILLVRGGIMPILVGDAPKQLEPPLQNPLDIVPTMVKGCNTIVSLYIVGGPVARPDYPGPLFLGPIQLTISLIQNLTKGNLTSSAGLSTSSGLPQPNARYLSRTPFIETRRSARGCS